jgi:hypothetical protein
LCESQILAGSPPGPYVITRVRSLNLKADALPSAGAVVIVRRCRRPTANSQRRTPRETIKFLVNEYTIKSSSPVATYFCMDDPDHQSKLPSPSTGFGETLSLTDKQRWLCGRLDELYRAANRTRGVPSDMYRSALYVMQPAQRGRNPDWMAQSAHSLRELLYPFFKSNAEVGRRDALSRYGVAGDADALSKAIAVHYSFMTSIAHHEWEQAAKNSIMKTLPVSDSNDRGLLFEAALSAFEDVLFRALQRQLDVHAEIDAFVSETQSDAAILRRLLAVNFDARRYFFTVAPELLLDWLRDNAFLQPIWEAPESPTNPSLSRARTGLSGEGRSDAVSEGRRHHALCRHFGGPLQS